MAKPTRTYLLLEARLERPLADYVTERREAGDSWNVIAYELAKATDVMVTAQTLTNWFPELQRERAAAS